MVDIAYNQLYVFIFQCAVVAIILLGLFKLRGILGMVLFYMTLGLFKYMHFFFTRSFSVEILNGIHVSMGSVLFVGIIFSILLIYIREGALEARKVIYAMIGLNIVFALTQILLTMGFNNAGFINKINLPDSFFTLNMRLFIVGNILILLDGIFIIYFYEIISSVIKSLFLRIFLTMVLVFYFDTVLFALGGFVETSYFETILTTGLVSKTIMLPIFSLLFWAYLTFLDKPLERAVVKFKSYKDVFDVITYQQKYEQVFKEKKVVVEKLFDTENYLQTIFDSTTDAIFIHDGETGKILDVNAQMCQMFGYKKNEVLNQNMQLFSSGNPNYTLTDALNWIKKAKTDGIQTFEWQSKHKEGHLFWTEVSLKFVNLSGKKRCLATVRNIEERKKAEEEIKIRANAWQTTFDAMSDSVCIIDLDHKILQYNTATLSMFNLKAADFKDKHCHDLIHCTSKPLPNCPFVRMTLSHSHESMVFFQNEKWYSVTVDPIFDDDKKLIGGVHVVVDITEHKQIEEKIKESEFKYKTIFNNSLVSFYTFNKEKEFIATNLAGVKLLGYTKEELLKLKITDVDANTEVVKPAYKNLLKGGNLVNFEHQLIRKDGKVITVLNNSISLKDKEGLVIGMQSFLLDITQQKKSEENLKQSNKELQKLYKLSQALSKSLGEEGLANQALAEIQQAVKPDVALFYTLNNDQLQLTAYRKDTVAFDLTHEKTHPLGRCLCGLTASTKKAIFSEDIFKDLRCTIDTCKNSGLISFAGIPLLIGTSFLGVIGLGFKEKQDFSKNRNFIETLVFDVALGLQNMQLLSAVRKHKAELEEKIAQRTAQLEQSNIELKDFAQVVSHDLKAPLRAISLLSYWLSQDYADKIDAAGQEQLNLIISRTKRLDDLIEGILQYSRIGKIVEKEETINFNTKVKDIIEALDVPAHIKIKIDNTLPIYKGDMTRFRQLFQNLISNAITYIDKPVGDIHIGCKTKENFYEFYISDNGIGIEEKYFERIFKIFQRLESRDTKEGTGVGLTLVKKIVQIYGGKIRLRSEVGKGTTFYFTLPILKN